MKERAELCLIGTELLFERPDGLLLLVAQFVNITCRGFDDRRQVLGCHASNGLAGFRKWLRDAGYLCQQSDQLAALSIVFVCLAAQGQDITGRQRLKRFGQVAVGRDGRVVEQDRNDRLAVLEGERDLLADEIIGVVETPPALGVRDIEPLRSDQRQQDGALFDSLTQRLRKDMTAFDGAAVEEDAFVAEPPAQVFMQGARVSGGIAAAVTDEDQRLVGNRNGPHVRSIEHYLV